MCGIVGLYLKNNELQNQLGKLFMPMLSLMGDRGPDSSGFAVYRGNNKENNKIILYSSNKKYEWSNFKNELKNKFKSNFSISHIYTHAILEMKVESKTFREWMTVSFPELRIMSIGNTLEIYKEVGMPEEVMERFNVSQMSGSHMIGHTRMATESAVTTEGAHPYNTGDDLCLVHNGSLSNHNDLKRWLEKEKGIIFQTENDTEVAAAYLAYKINEGSSLVEALESSIEDLDGFYTFTVGTKSGFAVLRDPIACKPAVLAETDDWVAMASEYRAISRLPNVVAAKVWEPKPGKIYSWGD
tara:strand:- start:168 stop:1064 length:897 start_codon:yes stop_codon:yes gene_type:complete